MVAEFPNIYWRGEQDGARASCRVRGRRPAASGEARPLRQSSFRALPDHRRLFRRYSERMEQGAAEIRQILRGARSDEVSIDDHRTILIQGSGVDQIVLDGEK